MTANQLRAAIRSWRLDRGWTYEQLASDIQRVNGDGRVSAASVRRFIAEDHQLTERLEHAIRAYVEHVKVAA